MKISDLLRDKDNMFLELEQINLCQILENENSEYCEREDENMKMLIPKINLYTRKKTMKSMYHL